MARPDKEKVVDEVWDDERIQSFLQKGPMGSESTEHSLLLHAYRSMRPEDFGRFLDAFKAEGYDIHAKNRAGETLAESIAHHKKAGPFITLLQTK